MTKYKTIYADAPWAEFGGGKIRRGANKHYPLMKTKDIIEYMKQIEVDDNAHIYMWATNNYLEDALEVMNEMGFRYITNLVWVKDRIGLGQYFRGQHELLLFGVKGKLPYKTHPSKIPTIVMAKRTEHSRKPIEFYDIIETTSYAPYVEVFSRKSRTGWDSMGNEVGKFDEKPLNN